MIEVLKQALTDAKRNERHNNVAETRYWLNQYKLIAEQAIAGLESQEPVAYLCEPDEDGLFDLPTPNKSCKDCFPVYRHPQRTLVVLTDDEIDQGLLRTPYAMKTAEAWREGVRWAYHQLKEKNT